MTRRDLHLEVVRLEAELAGIGETAKALAAEVERLAGERDDLKRQMEPELVSVGNAPDGSVEARFRCDWAVKAMAGSFADFLADAPNWRSVVVGPIPWTGDSLIVTVQRADGTTPAETVAAMRERLDLLLDRARPIPSAEPGAGPVGVAIHLDGREWDYAKGEIQ